jgi:hypothetical protein
MRAAAELSANVEHAVVRAAGALQVLAYDIGAEHLREHDLQTEVCRSLRMTLTGEAAPATRPQVPAKLEDWPGVGAFDVGAEVSDVVEVAIELKLARDADTISQNGWDALKLGLGLACGRAAAAFVIAAAPTAAFEGWPGSLPDVLGGWTCDTRDGLNRFRHWWEAQLKGSGAWPRALPARIRSRPVADASIRTPSADWSLRAAAIELDGEGMIAIGSDGFPVPDEATR